MLRFKQFILEQIQLLEDRIDFLKQQFAGKLDASHDPYGVHKDHENIVDHFATNADPTKNKAHTQWILRQYQRGKIRQEDHPRIKETLSNFEKYKGKLENKDLNSYKSLSDVEDAVSPHIGTVSSGKEERRQVKSEGADLIHSENGFEVRHLKNKDAACEYGKGTKWCTAATGGNNMFDNYNEDGPLYFIKGRDNSGEFKKYQYHPATNQFMDERDEPVTMSTFVERNPEMRNVKHFAGYDYSLPLKPEHKKELSDELHKLIDDKNMLSDVRDEKLSKAVKEAHTRGYLDDTHLDKLTSDPSLIDTHHQLAYDATYNMGYLNPRHINNITKSSDSTKAHSLLAGMYNKYGNVLGNDDINNIVNNPDSNEAHHRLLRGHFNNNLKLSPEHLTTIANNPNSTGAHLAMVTFGLADKDHINSILDNKSSTEAHRKLLDDHIDPEETQKLSDEHFTKLLQNFGQNQSLNRYDVDRLLKAHNSGRIKLTDDHMNHIINGSNKGALLDIAAKSANQEDPLITKEHGKLAVQRLMGIRPPE